MKLELTAWKLSRGRNANNMLSRTSLCRLQYKYSKLVMTSGGKECELPTADSCAIMEGEDAEDDVMYLNKKSFFYKIKPFSREVSYLLMHALDCVWGNFSSFCYYHCNFIYHVTLFWAFRGRLMGLTQFHLSHLHSDTEKRTTQMMINSDWGKKSYWQRWKHQWPPCICNRLSWETGINFSFFCLFLIGLLREFQKM